MNGQPYSSVNLSKTYIPLEARAFWNIATLPQATTLNILRQDNDKSKTRYSCMGVTDITFWFDPVITIDLATLRKVCAF